MFENLTWNIETILVLGIVTFTVFALLGLVIWNSKTNKQVKTLISIDDSLKHLETIEPLKESETAPVPAEIIEPQEIMEEEVVEVATKEEPQNRDNIGRSGRVYTKEELEAQIR